MTEVAISETDSNGTTNGYPIGTRVKVHDIDGSMIGTIASKVYNTDSHPQQLVIFDDIPDRKIGELVDYMEEVVA